MSDQRKKAAPKRGDLYLMVGCLLAALVCCCLWFLLRQDGVPGVDSVGKNEPNETDRDYIARVLEGVLRHRPEIDEKIETAARGWALDRMPMVDLIIMRLAVWEMMFEPSVPGSVSIAEALELTERYSDPEDKKFVNGVLGTILRELEAAQ